MIDLAKLKELVALMSQNDLAEVALKNGDEEITIKRGGQTVLMTAAPMSGPMQMPSQMQSMQVQGTAQAATASTTSAPGTTPTPGTAPVASSVTVSIDSPMVGTYYSRPNPDAKGFVTVGQAITADTVVCIIEAMKVFNEIKAEKSGEVVEILVKDGQSVEFGQKLIAIK